MNIIELVGLAAGAFYVGVNLGERLCLVIDKVMYRNQLYHGCVYFHRTTGKKVVIESMISGGLFKKPMVKFSVGNKGLQLQMNLGEFLKQFVYDVQYKLK